MPARVSKHSHQIPDSGGGNLLWVLACPSRLYEVLPPTVETTENEYYTRNVA